MTRSRYDVVGAVLLAFSVGFSVGVALADWEWFPSDHWNDIAFVPPTLLNYAALLLPWVLLLLFLVVRRHWFGSEMHDRAAR